MDWTLNNAACARLRIGSLEATVAPTANIIENGTVQSPDCEWLEG